MNRLTVRHLALAGTTPSNQVLTMVRRAADATLGHCLDRDDAYLIVTETLLAVGYMPPADGLARWQTLLEYIDGFQRWDEAGANSGETGMTEATWLRMIREELVAVAGRAT